MSQAPIAVIAALAEELAPLRTRLRQPRLWSTRPRVWRGWLGRTEVALAVTGDGARNAQQGGAAVLDRLPAAALLVLGSAGALTPSLGVGEVVFGEEVRGPAAARLRPDGPLARLARAANARAAMVITSDDIADTWTRKRALARENGEPACAVVDLESAYYAAAAEARSIPWLVLRAVSDVSGDSLPAMLNRCRDTGGAIDRAHVLRALVREPFAMRALYRLWSRVRMCGERLADAAEQVTRAWPRESTGCRGGSVP